MGNDANAHISGFGLGASYVSVTDAYFSQVMGNSITAGGVRADAHHPSDSRMINTHLTFSNNIFYNVSSLYSSTVPIFVSYVQDTVVSHNDLYITPYSVICHGFGWGSNDAGGSTEYTNRGLYNFQPKYSTSTTSQNNRIDANLIHGYGLSHTDLGAIYTLSRSTGTKITNNYAYDSSGFGLYNDEGSDGYTATGNLMLSDGIWLAQNQARPTNTFTDNFGKIGGATTGNTIAASLSAVSLAGRKAAYRAGVEPGKRAGRPISNADIADGEVTIVAGSKSGTVDITVNNFDDVTFTGVSYTITANGAALQAVSAPTSIPANGAAMASFSTSGSGKTISASVKYTNPRTGKTSTRTATKTV